VEKQYLAIWTKWIGFLQSDIKIRKEVLDSVHLEVKQGFTAIAKISLEELEHLLANTPAKAFFDEQKSEFDVTLQYCVWIGYMLFLVCEGIDPVEKNLVALAPTNELGNNWVSEYEKDKGVSLLMEIDPLLSMFLQQAAQSEFNQLLKKSSTKANLSFDDATKIISFLQWPLHQGYVLGVIEKKLNNL